MKISLIIILFFPIFLIGQTWQQIGPEGGYFKEFAFHPSNSSILYAGSDDGGGIWKTTNNGVNWSLLTSNFPNMTGWSITIDPNTPDTLYACDVYGRYGLLKSIDGGLNWNQKITGLTTTYDKMVSGLAIKTSDTLFISTGEASTTTPPRPGNGIFKSFNGGDTWTAAGLQGITIPCVNNNLFGTIFAGTESNGLQYSNDNGTSWIAHPDVSSTAVIHEIDIKDSVIVLGSSTGVYLSTNWGINFINIGLVGDFNFDVSIHKTAPNVELFCSTFSGFQLYSSSTSSWNIVSNPLLNNQFIMGISSNGDNVYLGAFSNSPIIKSVDGGINWNITSSSPIVTELNDIYIDPTNPNRILSCLLGTYNIGGGYNKECIYETTNGGGTWLRKGPNAHGLCLAVNPLNSNQLFLGTFSQGLFKTDNSFSTYTNLINGNMLIGDIAVSQSDTNVIIISEADLDSWQVSIKRSTDGGSNFSNVATLLANRVLFNSNNNDTVYAATNNGVYLSIDNGVTWNSWQLAGSNILSLAYNSNILYAGTDDGILYKIENSIATDISGNWQTPIELKSIFTMNNELFVGLNGAEKDTTNNLHGSIWQTSDNGNNWANITNQMTSTNIYGNNIITSDGNELYVGTYGGGIFKSTGLTLDVIENKMHNSISLYPNPANNFITLNSKNGIITYIQLLNNLGQNVSNSVKKKHLLSTKVIIDISALPSGVYIVLTQTNNKITTANKMYKQ